MPGFIIHVREDKEQLQKGLDSLKFDSRFECEKIFENKGVCFRFNGYSTYPHTIVETETFFCLIEGCVYNASAEQKAYDLFELIKKESFQEIGAQIKQLDGEFVFCFYLKEKEQVIIINDAWGRLPIYYTVQGETVILTREISFVSSYLPKLTLSKVDAALYSMFGYTLGDSTIFDGINKLSPHSVAIVHTIKPCVEVHNSFDIKGLVEKTDEEDCEKLIQALEEATFRRVSKFEKPSLSLSGGLDSRLIAGLIAKRNAPVSFTTFDIAGSHEKLDLIGAKQITKTLNWENRHDVISLKAPTVSDRKYLLNIKQGLNGLEMAFIIPYLKAISKFSDCSLTGDGGDKFFVDLRPMSNIKTRQGLVRSLLRTHTKLSPKRAATLFGVSERSVLQKIESTIDSYGMTSLNDSFVAFQIRERGMNWLFEGEDRNRTFIWSTSPFYDPQVIKTAMSFSMKSKQYGALFKGLFERIPGSLGQIVNPNWKVSLDELKEIKWVYRKQKIKSFVPQFILGNTNVRLSKRDVYNKWEAFENEMSMDLSSIGQLNIDTVVVDRIETLVEQFHSSSE